MEQTVCKYVLSPNGRKPVNLDVDLEKWKLNNPNAIIQSVDKDQENQQMTISYVKRQQ